MGTFMAPLEVHAAAICFDVPIAIHSAEFQTKVYNRPARARADWCHLWRSPNHVLWLEGSTEELTNGIPDGKGSVDIRSGDDGEIENSSSEYSGGARASAVARAMAMITPKAKGSSTRESAVARAEASAKSVAAI